MANLPVNQTYNTGTASSIPKPVSQLKNLPAYVQKYISTPGSAQQSGPTDIGSQLAARGMPIGMTPATLARSQNPAQENTPALPTQTPFDSTKQPSEQPLPEGYWGFQSEGRGPGNYAWTDPNLDTTALRSISGVEGQYATDFSQPGKMIKSVRPEGPAWFAEKDIMLDGRSPYLYEVDHIIPLWAGGVDTQANYQVLTKTEHYKKTKAQAVPYTLLVNGLISQPQAKMMAMSWKDKDLSDIPDLVRGVMPLEDAKEIKARWDKQAAEGPGVSWKSFTEAIPEAVKKLPASIDAGIKALGLPGFLGEAVKGVESGLSAGWVPYIPEAEANLFEKAVGYTGVIAGSLLPIARATQGIRLVGRGLASITGKKLLEKGITSKATNYLGIQTVVPAVSTARKEASRQALSLIGNSIVLPGLGFAAYGQVGPQGLAGEALQQEGAQAMERFTDDLVLGLMVPIAPTIFRGANVGARAATSAVLKRGAQESTAKPFYAARETLKEFTTDSLLVGALAASVSIADDPEHPGAALTNGITMGVLHGVGLKYAKGQLEKERIALEQQRKDGIRTMAHNVLATYTPTLQPIKAGQPAPSPYTLDQVVSLRGEAMGKLDDMLKEGLITPETYHKERTAIFVNSKLLGYESLPEPILRQELINDYISLAAQSKRLGGSNPYIPDEVYTTVKTMEDTGLLSKSFKTENAVPASGKYPVGEFRLSGVAGGVNPYVNNVQQYLERKAVGRASPTLIGVDRPEMEPILRAVNNRITPDDIKANRLAPHKNPQNAVQWFAVSWDENNNKMITPVGWSPRRSHIAEVKDGGTITSFNETTKKTPVGQKLAKEGREDPFREDPEFNKDTVSTAMKKEGVRVLYGNINDLRSGTKALGSGEPYIHVTLNDENWARSIADSGLPSRGAPANRSLPQMVREVNSSLNAKKKAATIKEMREKVAEPAHEVFETTPSSTILAQKNPESAAATQDLFKEAYTAFSAQTPEEMSAVLQKEFGMQLDEPSLMDIFNRRNEITSGEFLSLVQKNADTPSKIYLKEFILPFVKSDVFTKEWEMGKSFMDLRVVGGVKARGVSTSLNESTPIAPEAGVQTQNTVAAAPQQPELPMTPQVNPLAARVVAKAKQMPLDMQQKGTSVPTTTTPRPVEYLNTNTEPAYKAPAKQSKQQITKEAARSVGRAYAESAKELEDRGMALLEDVQVPKDRNQYTKQLRNIILALDPTGQVPSARELSGTRPFTSQERNAISKRVKERLAMRAEGMVERNFDPDNEIAFKVNVAGAGSSDELMSAMKSIIRADTLRGLGNLEGAQAILREIPEKELARASELLGMKNIEGMLKITPKERKPPTVGEYKELQDVQSKLHEKTGQEQIMSIEEGLKSPDPEKPYKYALATTLDKGLKQMLGNYKSPEMKRLIGSVFTDLGISKKFGSFKKSSTKELFKTHRTEGNLQPISHTKEYLIALGKGEDEAINVAKAGRKEQLARHQRDKDLGSMDKPEDLLTGNDRLDVEDLTSGGMRILSPTQDIDMEKEVSKVFTKLYPGLNASIVEGIEATAAHGVRDGRVQLQYIQKEVNDFLKKMGKDKKVSLGLMKGSGWHKDAQTFKERSKEKTQSFYRDILEKIEKDLADKGNGGGN